jgi:hypothetical protein
MSPYWLIVALGVIFGAAILGRWKIGLPSPSREPRARPTRAPVERLKPGETYDNAVKLATVPNVPMGDLWCQRLRAEGIEAFYKSGAATPGWVGDGGHVLNPLAPVEVWVGEHHVARARELFPELA